MSTCLQLCCISDYLDCAKKKEMNTDWINHILIRKFIYYKMHFNRVNAHTAHKLLYKYTKSEWRLGIFWFLIHLLSQPWRHTLFFWFNDNNNKKCGISILLIPYIITLSKGWKHLKTLKKIKSHNVETSKKNRRSFRIN